MVQLLWVEQVITDITKGMGEGMADFIEKEVLTVADYDLYCHYVAGLVGIGLSQVTPPSIVACTWSWVEPPVL